MRFKIIIIFCLFTFLISSFDSKNSFQDDEIILWSSDRKLTWSDFKGVVDTSNVFIGAMTYAEIKIEGSYLKDSIRMYKVGCYFLKNKSWHIVNDSSSLSHEQLHFDISELFARKIRKSFDSLYVKRIVDVMKYEKVFNMHLNNWDKYQDLYDSETHYNEKKQLFWQKKIAVALTASKKWEYIAEK
ncbi:DUF922 domain-containing protein [Flavobacterium sp. GCM10027622]|uniref:DUF922 domain-containing protein n=1 Tax=unclassified Flavobacterium TaxID=196869 RepID=UPI003617E76F